MERNTIDEMLEILTAYKEGKEIECYNKDVEDWCLVTNPNFNFKFTYRIKPQPKVKKLVPFTYEDDLLGKFIKHKTSNEKSIIVEQTISGVFYGTNSSFYKYLLDYYTFLDGTPCGKYIEE